MQIRDLLSHKGKDVFTIKEDATSLQALKVLNDKRVGALMVVASQAEIKGIVSERDLLAKFEQTKADVKITELMTPADKLIIVHENDSVEFALKTFTENKIRHLPVFDGNQLVGIISIGDAVRAMLRDMEAENKMLRDYISGTFPVFN